MKIPLVDLKRQYIGLKPKIDKSVQEVCLSGNFGLGKEVSKFETSFSRYCNTKYAIGVASGFDAILLILRALDIKEGDEIITVANTFISTILPIIYLKAVPVFVDINPLTNNINVNKIEPLITSRTKAILPVHLYGYPADMDSLKKISKKYNLFLIEDACQAHGSEYKNKRCGSLSDAAAFSFYPAKNLGAFGQAGAVLTNDAKIAKKVKILREIGQEKKYEHTMLGYNSRLDSIQAAILSVKLNLLDRWNKRRNKIAEKYTKLLTHKVKKPTVEENYHTNFHVYCIETSKRNQLKSFLERAGIECGIHYPIPLHLQKSMKSVRFKRGELTVTESKAKNILSLPIFPEMSDSEVEYVVRNVNKFFES